MFGALDSGSWFLNHKAARLMVGQSNNPIVSILKLIHLKKRNAKYIFAHTSRLEQNVLLRFCELHYHVILVLSCKLMNFKNDIFLIFLIKCHTPLKLYIKLVNRGNPSTRAIITWLPLWVRRRLAESTSSYPTSAGDRSRGIGSNGKVWMEC